MGIGIRHLLLAGHHHDHHRRGRVVPAGGRHLHSGQARQRPDHGAHPRHLRRGRRQGAGRAELDRHIGLGNLIDHHRGARHVLHHLQTRLGLRRRAEAHLHHRGGRSGGRGRHLRLRPDHALPAGHHHRDRRDHRRLLHPRMGPHRLRRHRTDPVRRPAGHARLLLLRHDRFRPGLGEHRGRLFTLPAPQVLQQRHRLLDHVRRVHRQRASHLLRPAARRIQRQTRRKRRQRPDRRDGLHPAHLVPHPVHHRRRAGPHVRLHHGQLLQRTGIAELRRQTAPHRGRRPHRRAHRGRRGLRDLLLGHLHRPVPRLPDHPRRAYGRMGGHVRDRRDRAQEGLQHPRPV